MQDTTVIRMVVTDLDGTLWPRDGAVPRSTRDAMAELERRQIPLLAASARRSSSASYFFQRAGIDLPAVLLNGALGRDKGGGPTFHQRSFDPAAASVALSVFTRHGVTPCASFESQEWDVVSGPVPSSGVAYLVWATSQLKQVDDLQTLVVSLPVFAYSVVACPEADSLHAIRDELAQTAGIGMVNVFADKVFGGWTLDCAPSGVNKWSGVDAYCRYRGIDPGHILAIGDGDNDVELLGRASRSCAMSHATEKAKAAAHVTLTGGLDGWRQLLDYL
jgi:hydroxymethylpyrimidine pyrophosphatase-like HAD family hydrolase